MPFSTFFLRLRRPCCPFRRRSGVTETLQYKTVRLKVQIQLIYTTNVKYIQDFAQFMMTSHGFGESGRAKRLDACLNKALEVSSASFNEIDLSECFGSIKTQFGASMMRLFSNMLVKLRSNMEASYKDICIRRDLDDRLLALENAKYVDTGNVSSTETINSSTEELKRIEAESLKAVIKQIAVEVANLQQKSNRLKAAVTSELQVLRDERHTLAG
jgi:hypothetical protein